MRFWLLTIPATIVDGWFTAYRVLLCMITMLTVSIVTVSLLLAAVGIRWGW